MPEVKERFSLQDLISCASREVAMRQRLYPRWVAEGRMTREKAAREVDLMQEIVERLRALSVG